MREIDLADTALESDSRLLSGLNPEQRAAVTTTDGPVLIVAGPGSGKTRVLTVRVAHLIEVAGVAPWHILAVTFTNKAAREMRERIEHIVGERAAWITIGTFHAFCARILRQYGAEIGINPRFAIYDDGDQMSAIKRSLEALDINPRQFAPRAVLSRISRAKSLGITPTQFRDTAETYWEEVVARVYPVYQETLQRRSALDFDDLLVAAVQLLRQSESARRALQQRYTYVLVDEYQDTNRIQYDLIREMTAESRNLCVVGDPDQSIYGWRAADISNILTFKQDYPDAVEIHLEENYRSTPEILAAADGVIRENVQRIDRALRTSNVTGANVVVRESFDEGHEARLVIEEILRLQREHGIPGREIAVLYRTNAQSRAFEEACIRAGLPYQLIGGTRFYERKEIKDALAILRLVANPDDAAAFERVIDAFPVGAGIGDKTIADIEAWSARTGNRLSTALAQAGQPGGPGISSRAAKQLRQLSHTVTQLREMEPDLALPEFFDRVLAESGYRELFASGDPELADRWENVEQLRGTLAAYDVLDPRERLTTFLEEVALVSDADTIQDVGQRITLITLHAVKGLEFDVVFITGVEEGLIPHARSVQENPAMLEEERRLFYVGITRARKRLYLTYTFKRSRYGNTEPSVRSSFVNTIPSAVLDLPQPARSERKALFAAPSPAEPPPTIFTRVEPGERVFHVRFGEGVVLATTDKDDDQEVTVDFKRHGQKLMLGSMAKFSVLSDGDEGDLA